MSVISGLGVKEPDYTSLISGLDGLYASHTYSVQLDYTLDLSGLGETEIVYWTHAVDLYPCIKILIFILEFLDKD